jgi:hypothetical protein
VKKRVLTDAERIRLRKKIEQRWLSKWRGRLSDPAARLDLLRAYHRVGLIEISTFRHEKAVGGFYEAKDK